MQRTPLFILIMAQVTFELTIEFTYDDELDRDTAELFEELKTDILNGNYDKEVEQRWGTPAKASFTHYVPNKTDEDSASK